MTFPLGKDASSYIANPASTARKSFGGGRGGRGGHGGGRGGGRGGRGRGVLRGTPPRFWIAQGVGQPHALRRFGGTGVGGRGCGCHTRGGPPGRMIMFSRTFDTTDNIENDWPCNSPAHAKLARLQQRAMRLERRLHNEGGDNNLQKIPQKNQNTTRVADPITIPHEVHEDSDSFRLKLVIPGYGPSSLTVTIGPFGHFLRIRGKKDANTCKKDNNSQGNQFDVAFKVNGKFDMQQLPHGAKASLSNGILNVSITKDPTYGQATAVVVSEAVALPDVSATSQTDADGEVMATTEEADDDGFVDVAGKTMQITPTPISKEMTSTTITTLQDCVDKKKCVEDGMDEDYYSKKDDYDNDDDEDADATPESDSDSKLFRRLVELPGVRLEDLKVEHECEGRILRVTAVRRAHLTGYKKDKTFQETFRLRPIARGVDISNLTASLDHGVLCITAPRTTTSIDQNNKDEKSPKRFLIPVMTDDGVADEEDTVVDGFESMELSKSESRKDN